MSSVIRALNSLNWPTPLRAALQMALKIGSFQLQGLRYSLSATHNGLKISDLTELLSITKIALNLLVVVHL